MKYRCNISLAMLLLSFTWVMAQQNQDISVPLSDPGKRGTLYVEIHKGPITVKGVNRQDVLVKYQSLSGGETKITEAKNGMKKISGGFPSLEVVEEGNEVYVESEDWNKGLSLNIEVPRNFDLQLESYNDADVVVENIVGKIAIETYNGHITAKDIEGSVVANTYNGPIVVTFNKISTDEPMTFVTYNGKVDITLPSAAKANFKMKTQRGDMYTDFDMQLTKSPNPIKNEGDKWKRTVVDNWISGSINGGGPEFSMQTWNGDIYIRKK
ncbi:MAG: DUF4097 family beta strand repeat protein [Saprospiraceae bacterium]|nr:DUF4097 family beta strand repeat protein [Saprospiraceae bacterium]